MSNLLKMNRNGNKKYEDKYIFNIILVAFENTIQNFMIKIKVRNDRVFSIHLTKLNPRG